MHHGAVGIAGATWLGARGKAKAKRIYVPSPQPELQKLLVEVKQVVDDGLQWKSQGKLITTIITCLLLFWLLLGGNRGNAVHAVRTQFKVLCVGNYRNPGLAFSHKLLGFLRCKMSLVLLMTWLLLQFV